jgi:hypothetical protein
MEKQVIEIVENVTLVVVTLDNNTVVCRVERLDIDLDWQLMPANEVEEFVESLKQDEEENMKQAAEEYDYICRAGISTSKY